MHETFHKIVLLVSQFLKTDINSSNTAAASTMTTENDATKERQDNHHQRRTNQRDREDREAKRRAREDRIAVGIGVGAPMRSKTSLSEREGVKAKARTKSTSTYRSTTKDEDTKAKSRAKSSRSSHRHSATKNNIKSDRIAKGRSHSPSRAVTPGAVSVGDKLSTNERSSSAHRSRKEAEKSKRARRSAADRVQREKTKAHARSSSNNDAVLPKAENNFEPEVELLAEAVEVDEDGSKFRSLAYENEELRREMQEMLQTNNHNQISRTREASEQGGTLEEQPKASNRGKYICVFVLLVVAIVTGVVIFFRMRSKAALPMPPDVITDETPSSSPSLVVTSVPTLSEQTVQDCLAISEGRPVHNQDELIKRQLKLKFQVSLVDESDIGMMETLALQGKIQQGPLLSLAGCDPTVLASGIRGTRRMSLIDSNVGDAKVIIVNVTDFCANIDGGCAEIEAELLLFLETSETDTSLLQMTQFVFGQDTFAKSLEPPFGNIKLMDVGPQDLIASNPVSSSPSALPSGIPTSTSSLNPTRAPGSDPTIEPSASQTKLSSGPPSISPSSTHSAGPTSMSSQSPTDIPVADPTESPTAASAAPSISISKPPTQAPTKTPTSNSPTTVPSTFPSLGPSNLPSTSPSDVPSGVPSQSPSSLPSVLPSEAPSNSPSFEPGRCGPLIGGRQCSCDSEYYHCSVEGYCGYGADVGDFFVEGEPREYDCPTGPVSLITSSAVTSQISTRTSSTGEVMGAWKAIDGNMECTDYYASSATNFHNSAWWQIDFGFTTQVEKITIWNILGSNNWNRIAGSTLELYDSNGGLLSTSDITLGVAFDPPSETFFFDPPIENVAVAKVQRPASRNPLHICKFQAFGYIQ